MVLTTSQARRRTDPNPSVVISTPDSEIVPTPTEKLLGAWIHQDLKWAEHLQDNKENLLRALTTRLSAIIKLGQVASLRTRKMIANGVFMSKLTYLISVWGGCEGYLLKSLQVIQNKVARVVTKMPWSTPTRTLLLQCGWLSVRQLAMYSSVMLVYKAMQAGSPEYIRGMFSNDYGRITRQALWGMIKPS